MLRKQYIRGALLALGDTGCSSEGGALLALGGTACSNEGGPELEDTSCCESGGCVFESRECDGCACENMRLTLNVP